MAKIERPIKVRCRPAAAWFIVSAWRPHGLRPDRSSGYRLRFFVPRAGGDDRLRWLLDPLLGDTLPFTALLGAVAAAVWLSGFRAAVAVAVVGYFAANYLFVSPRGEFTLTC